MLASQWVWQRTKSVRIPAEEQNAGRVVDYFYRMEFHITPRFFSDSNYLFFIENLETNWLFLSGSSFLFFPFLIFFFFFCIHFYCFFLCTEMCDVPLYVTPAPHPVLIQILNARLKKKRHFFAHFAALLLYLAESFFQILIKKYDQERAEGRGCSITPSHAHQEPPKKTPA